MTDLLRLDPDQLLSTTRSVRKRLDLEKPVPMEVLRECLEVALQAPSGSNQQHWHWLVVTDPEKRKAIIRQFEKRLLDEEAHYLMTLQWHRIIPHSAKVKGWTITPSHYLNNTLDTVWLDQSD